jgi:hypothetical protein
MEAQGLELILYGALCIWWWESAKWVFRWARRWWGDYVFERDCVPRWGELLGMPRKEGETVKQWRDRMAARVRGLRDPEE